MADYESRIGISIDADGALAAIKNLQSQISAFHQSIRNSGNAVNQAVSDNLAKNLLNSINATKKFSASLTTVNDEAQAFTNALEKNKLSLGQYFKYGVASSKNFSKVFSREFATIEKVARERVKTLQTQYISMGRNATGALEAIKVRPLRLEMEALGTQVAMTAQKQQIFNQLVKQGSTNLLNFGKNTQWAGRQLMVGFTIPLSMLGSVAAKSFMDLEKQVLRFRRVYGETFTAQAETDKMVSQIQQLASEYTKYGIEVSKTMELAADAAAMGKQNAELLAQVAEATKLAVLGEVEQQEALKTTISISNAFGIAAEDLANKINFLNAVENQTVTSIEDLTVAIPKAGPVVKQLGGSVEDLAYFLTAMKEGGINASEGANALKSGLASIINPTKQSKEMLAELGININGIVEGNAGNLKATMLGVAQALDTLDPLNRARAIEQLFGKFQFARISTLFENITKEGTQASRVLDIMSQSAAELEVLSRREMKAIEDSPMFKFQKAVEDIQKSLVPLGEQFLKLITPVVEFGTDMLKKFNEMDEGAKRFVTNLVGFFGLVAPAAIMAFGLVANGVANFIKGLNFVRLMFGKLAGAGTGLNQMTSYMTQEQLEATASASALGQAHSALTTTFTSERVAVEGLTTAYRNAITALNQYNVAAQSRVRPGQAPGAPKKYAKGVLSVPGPKGKGDIIPAMLSPGEAVVPAKEAQRYRPLIAGIISGNIPGFSQGSLGVNFKVSQGDAAKLEPMLQGIAKLPDGIALVQKAAERMASDLKITIQDVLREITIIAEQEGLSARKVLSSAGMSGEQIGKKRASQRSDNIPDQWAKERGDIGVEEVQRAQGAAAANRDAQARFFESQGMSPEDAMATANKKTQNAGIVRSHIENVGGTAKFAANTEAFSSDVTVAQSRTANAFLTGLSMEDPRTGKRKLTGSGQAMEMAIKDPEAGIDPAMQDTLLAKIKEDIGLTEQELIEQNKAVELILTKRRELLSMGTSNFESQLQGMRGEAEYLKSLPEPSLGVGARTPEEVARGKEAISRKLFRGNTEFIDDPKKNLSRKGNSLIDKDGNVVTDEQMQRATQGGQNIADGLLNAVDDGFDMNSPSREMFNRGKNIVRGMLDGVQEGYRESTGKQLPEGPIGGPAAPSAPPFMQKDPFDTYVEPQAEVPVEQNKAKAFGKKMFQKTEAALEKSLMEGALGKTKTGAMLRDTFIENALSDANIANGGQGAVLLDSQGNEIARQEAWMSRKDAQLSQEQMLNQQDQAILQQEGTLLDEEQINLRHEDGSLKTRRELIEEEKELARRKAAAEKAQQRAMDRDSRTLQRQAAAQKRQARAGKVMGALGTLTMVAGMATQVDGIVGETAQKLLPLLGGLTAVLPLLLALPLPLALLAAAIGGVVFGLYKWNEAINKSREEGRKLGDALTLSTDKLIKFSEATGRVSATEERAQLQQNQISGTTEAQRKFGQTFLESEAGKGLLEQINTLASSGLDAEKSAEAIGRQLALLVLQGVLDSSEASSIVAAIGLEIGDQGFSADISGELINLIGPNGEDITKDPLQVAIDIQTAGTEQFENLNEIVDKVINTDYSTADFVRQFASDDVKKEFESFSDGVITEMDKITDRSERFAAGGFDGFMAGVEGWWADTINDEVVFGMDTFAKGNDFNIAKEFLGRNGEVLTDFTKVQSASIQVGIGQLEENQQLLDAFEKQMDLKEKQLEADIAQEKNVEKKGRLEAELILLQSKRAQGVKELNDRNADTLDSLIEMRDMYTDSGAWSQAIQAATLARFSEDDPMRVLAESTLGQLAKIQDEGIRSTLELGLAGGELDITTVQKLLEVGDNGEITVNAKFKVAVERKGFSEVNQILQLAEGAGLTEDVALEVANWMTATDDLDAFERQKQALAEISQLETEYGIGINIENADEALVAINGIEQAMIGLEDQPEELTYEMVVEANTSGQFDEILSTWNELVGEDNVMKKSMIFEFMAYASGDSSALISFYLDSIGASGAGFNVFGGMTKADIDKIVIPWLIGGGKNEIKVDDPEDPDPDPSGSGTDPIEDLLKKLRELRNATINVKGGYEELKRVINDTSQLQIFGGVASQLIDSGVNKDFVGWVMRLDEDLQKEYIKIGKNGKVSVTKIGEAVASGINQINIGEGLFGLKDAAKSTQDQKDAYLALTKAGMDSSEALELVSNQALAAAINSEDFSETDMSEYIDQMRELLDIQEEYNSLTKYDELVDGQEKQIEQTDNQIAAAKRLIDLGYKAADAYALVANTDFANQISNKELTDDQVRVLATGQQEVNRKQAELAAGTAISSSEEDAQFRASVISAYDYRQSQAILASQELSNMIKLGMQDTEEFIKLLEVETAKIPEMFAGMGLETQLRNAKVGEGFIKWVLSQDLDVQKEYFRITEEGLVELTKKGKETNAALNEIAIGEVVNGLQASITASKNQSRAASKLIAAGLDAADAYSLVADEAFAASVMSKEMSTEELEEIVRLQTELADQTQRRVNLENVRKDIESFISKKELDAKINLEYPPLQAQAILNDETLRSMVELGQTGAEEFAKRLAQITNDPKFLNDTFGAGYSNVQQAFAVQEEQLIDDIESAMEAGTLATFSWSTAFGIDELATLVDMTEAEIKALMNIKDPAEVIEKAQQEIATINYEIDDLNAGLEDISSREESINKKYDDRLEALDKLAELNNQVAASQKSQLDVATALASGDIAAAARAMEEDRARRAQQATEDARKEIERQRDAELKSLKFSGMTREQLENKIKELQKEIADIEESRLEPAQRLLDLVSLLQDKNIEGQTVLEKTREQWDDIKLSVDQVNIATQEFIDLMQAALLAAQALTGPSALPAAGAPGGDGSTKPRGERATRGESLEQLAARLGVSVDQLYVPNMREGNRGGDYLYNDQLVYVLPDKDARDQYAEDRAARAAANEQTPSDQSSGAPGSNSGFSGVAEGNTEWKAADPASFYNQRIAEEQAKLDSGTLGPGARAAAQAKIDSYNNQKDALKSAMGGLIPRYAVGGSVRDMIFRGNRGKLFKSINTDTVPAMLTPGEFIIRRSAVQKYGVDNLKAINRGDFKSGSVYNYSVNVNVSTDADPDRIARAVMTEIKRTESQRIRRF